MSAIIFNSRGALTRVVRSFCNVRPASSAVYQYQVRLASSDDGGKLKPDEANQDSPDFEMENPYKKEKQQCILCKYSIELNYKNPRILSQFVSSFTGRPYDKHITGLCEKQHQALKLELQKAFRCGFMSAQHKDLRYVKDPPLFDPFRPTRPHPY